MILASGVLWSPPLLLDGKCVTGVPKGIDHITVTYPARRDGSTSQSGWQKQTITPNAQRRVSSLGIEGLRVTVTISPQGLHVTIGMTPAYVVGWASNVLVPPDSWTLPLITHSIFYVEESLGLFPTVALSKVRITRLDLTRNLHLSNYADMDLFLRTHAEYLPPSGNTRQMFIGANGATSVKKGNKSRFVTVYDKHAESRGACLVGTVRWECRMTRRVLAKHNLGRLGDLTPTRIEMARRSMWDWSGMNTAIASPSSTLQTIRRSVTNGTLTRGIAVAIVGSAVLGANGGAAATRKRHQRILRHLGVLGDLSDPAQMFDRSTDRVLRTIYSTGQVTASRYP